MSVTGMREARQAILSRSQAQAMAALAAPGMLQEELRRLAANHRPEWSGRRPMRSSADTRRGLCHGLGYTTTSMLSSTKQLNFDVLIMVENRLPGSRAKAAQGGAGAAGC